MEWQPRTFGEMQRDERVKRLERKLKLTQIRRSSSSQLLLASHMSTSGISSIHGDNPLSDFSYHNPTTNSSKVGSVIVASSSNLRDKVLKNLDVSKHFCPSTSTDIEPAMNNRKTDKDAIMMPPPVAAKNLKSKSSDHMGQLSFQQDVLIKGTDAATDTPVLEGYANDGSTSVCNIPPMCDSSRTDHFFLPQNQPALQQSAKNSDTSKQHVRNFRNWIVRLNARGQIIIKGKLESGEQARSKAVRRRLNANTLISVLNHKYRLVGNLCDSREELPEYVRSKFSHGFPTDWENVHQVWQSYVASGCSSGFRWPRPIADSDDDLRSDITELPALRQKYTSNKSATTAPPSSPHQPTAQKSENRMNGEASSEQAHIAKCSISSIKILATANSDQTITSKLVSSSENAVRDQSTQTNMQTKWVTASENERYIPRWKIDFIVGNMMDKNCPKEYFDKVVTAIDCINELFTLSSTNSTETANDEGIFLNYNSKAHVEMSSTQIDAQTGRAKARENLNQANLQYETQTASKADSYSLESLSEAEVDPPSKNKTYLYKESREMERYNIPGPGPLESLQKNNMMCKSNRHLLYDNPTSNDQNDLLKSNSAITSDNMRHRDREHRKNLIAPALPIEQSSVISVQNNGHNQRNILQTTDSEAEATYSNMQKAALSNNFMPVTTTSRITRKLKPKPIATDQRNDRIAGSSRVYCESDVSILTACITPSAKTKISTAEGKSDGSRKWHYERDTSLANLKSSRQKNDDHSQVTPSKAAETANSNTLNIPRSPTVRSISNCAVLLNKITTPQRNVDRSSHAIAYTENPAGYDKSRLGQETLEVPDNELENLNMRTSSRGRCLIPPLDYWKGERLMLKGHKLVYNPGMPHIGDSLASSSIFRQSMTSPNVTTLSEQPPLQNHNKNLKITPKDLKDQMTSNGQSSFKKDQKIDGVLSEISDNHNTRRSHRTTDLKLQVTPSNKISSKVRRLRTRNVVTLSTSDSDESYTEACRRKRKRIR